MTMKIVIADDHALFTDGLKNLLKSRGYEIAGIARDGLEAFKLAKKLKPDLMLIDIFMPHCDGLEATKLISANFPEIKIMIITSSEDEKNVFDAVKFGASGYFIKSFDSKQLFDSIEALHKGETLISPGLAGRILDELELVKKKQKDCAGQGLTERQREVLTLSAQGHTYTNIASNLNISERTVRYHIQSAIDKLHLQNRQQLISYASRSGMLDS